MTRTVVHYTDADDFGGAERVLLNTLEGLDRRRWRSVLFHHFEPGGRPLAAKARNLKIDIRRVPRVQTWTDVFRLPQFIRTIRDEGPAVFHAHLNWPLS
jgi:hypothetical protein